MQRYDSYSWMRIGKIDEGCCKLLHSVFRNVLDKLLKIGKTREATIRQEHGIE